MIEVLPLASYVLQENWTYSDRCPTTLLGLRELPLAMVGKCQIVICDPKTWIKGDSLPETTLTLFVLTLAAQNIP